MLHTDLSSVLLRDVDVAAGSGGPHSQSRTDVCDSRHVFFALVAAEQLVHLCDPDALGLWDTEKDPNAKDDAENKEEVEGSEGDRPQHPRCDESNNEVRQPIGRNGNSNCFTTDTWREHLGRHDPVDTADAECEVRNINPDEDCCCPSCSVVRCPAVLVHCIKCPNNKLRDAHADGTYDENLAAPPSIEEIDGWQCGEEVDDANDTSRQKINQISR